MEDKIFDALDTLDINQTDKLLDTDINMNIDSVSLKRIKKAVYKKAGLKKSKHLIKKGLTVTAAALVLAMLSMATIGVDNVANAFNRLFSFIPGYAIVENNKNIEYVIEKQNIQVENSDVSITIKNAIAIKDNITISLELEKKNFDESKALEGMQKEWEELEKGGQLKKPIIVLYANGKEYKTDNYSAAGGGSTESIAANFQIENINTQTTYKLEYKEYNLSLAFKLKAYDSFDSLEEIGPTTILNDISITAVSNIKDNKLEVELYPINKSKYQISSFAKVFDNGYEGKDLNLQTSNGIRKYTAPDSSMGANNKFYFDISPDDKDLVLKIPYLIVASNESQNISLKIPNEGEKLTLNEKVEFTDSTMIITDVERIKSDENEYGNLKINFRYENSDKNKIMYNAQFNRTNILGAIEGGGYSCEPDQNDILKSVYYGLEKGENSELRLKISKPEYYLLSEYSLELNW